MRRYPLTAGAGTQFSYKYKNIARVCFLEMGMGRLFYLSPNIRTQALLLLYVVANSPDHDETWCQQAYRNSREPEPDMGKVNLTNVNYLKERYNRVLCTFSIFRASPHAWFRSDKPRPAPFREYHCCNLNCMPECE